MSGKTVDKLTVTDLGVSVPGRQLVESLNISAPGGEKHYEIIEVKYL